MVPEVSSFHEVEHEVKRVSILEGVVHVDDEGRVELRQQYTFVHHALHALFGHYSASYGIYMDFSISFIAN